MPLRLTLNLQYVQFWCPQQKDENCKGSRALHEKNEREGNREALAE